jgi:hypothetical protein
MEYWQQEEMSMNTAIYKAIENKNIAAANNIEWWQQELLDSTKDKGAYGSSPISSSNNVSNVANMTATPPTPTSQPPQQSSNLVTNASVKIATPQYVDFDENILNPITEGDIVNLFFEQIAGHELLILSNKNFVNTKNIDYQPIANISNFKNTYDPKKIIALQDTSDVYFFNFAINLLARIPDVPTDSSTNGTNVYIDANGDLVIETKDNAPDERIQIEIISGGTIDTDILEVDES